MKNRALSISILSGAMVLLLIAGYRCAGGKKAPGNEPVEVIRTNKQATGLAMSVGFTKGKSFNHPLMAIWLEDTAGNYIETLYVAESIGNGIFRHGDQSTGHWAPGPVRRPAALPYWGHKRGIRAPDGYFLPTPDDPAPDAITGPTPQGNFILDTRSPISLPRSFKVMLELNQPWDWNEYWTNNKFPGDEQYKTSSQPALVYQAIVDLDGLETEFVMVPVGHSHYSGLDGKLYPDLGSLTTALHIADKITVRVIP